jgi:thiosulfate/3-mercaptopyruvate sulfurtransferase
MPVSYETVVPPSVLAGRLDRSWAVIDCRFDLQQADWGHEQYLASHVPGAVYAHLSRDLSGATTGRNGRHPLPSPDDMAATFGRFGIERGTQVVVYDQDAGMFASRLWWMLRYLGHEAVAVLDGGWARWAAEGHPVRSGAETRSPAAFVAAPQPGLVASLDEMISASASRDRLLVDARAPERFAGRSEPLDRAAGHIPGAVNHFFRQNVAPDGTMLPRETLHDSFSRALGGRDPGEVVMYCGSGITACHNLLAMAHAGLPGARLYPGSWSEWSSDPERPVETGD